jgi:hypothetical protein
MAVTTNLCLYNILSKPKIAQNNVPQHTIHSYSFITIKDRRFLRNVSAYI